MRYWFLKLEIQSGEYCVSTASVHKTKGKIPFDANDYAQEYWGEGEETYGDKTYYFDDGCVACSVYDCTEITVAEYNVMYKHL